MGLGMGTHRFDGGGTDETHVILLDATRVWNAVND
jgi:hypothetical protein